MKYHRGIRETAIRSLALVALLALSGADAFPGETSVVVSAFNHGKWIFSAQKSAAQPRPALYTQGGLAGRARLVLDPNSPDTPAKYLPDDFCISADGQYACLTLPQAEAPFEVIRVMEIATGHLLTDTLRWTVFSDIAWRGRGFYYAKYAGPLGDANTKPINQGVYFHRLGTPQSVDELVRTDPAHPAYFYTFLGTFDERFLFLHVTSLEVGDGKEAFFFRDDGQNEKRFTPLGDAFAVGRYFLCDLVGEKFVIFTTAGAGRGRVVAIDPAHPAEKWETLVAESREKLESADTAGGKLFLTYPLGNGGSRVVVCGLNGKAENNLPLPFPGKVDVQWGRKEDLFVFFRITPAGGSKSVFLYDVTSKQSRAFEPAR